MARGWVASWVGWVSVSKGEATVRSPLGTERSACPGGETFCLCTLVTGLEAVQGHLWIPLCPTPRDSHAHVVGCFGRQSWNQWPKAPDCAEVGRGAQEGLPLGSALTVPASPPLLPVQAGPGACLPEPARVPRALHARLPIPASGPAGPGTCRGVRPGWGARECVQARGVLPSPHQPRRGAGGGWRAEELPLGPDGRHLLLTTS